MGNLLVSKSHIGLIRELQVLIVIFIKKDFLDWLLDLKDLFNYENIYEKRKVKLALYKLREYALRWWEQMQFDRLIQGKEKICSCPRMKKMLAIIFYPLDCDD